MALPPGVSITTTTSKNIMIKIKKLISAQFPHATEPYPVQDVEQYEYGEKDEYQCEGSAGLKFFLFSHSSNLQL
jgi:hypothetical protein